MYWKKSILIFFVALITVGAIGVPVFTHTCKTENAEFKTFFVPSNHCKEEQIKEESCHATCCEEKKEDKTKLEQEDCCSDNVKEFKFSFDIFQKITQKYFLLASFTPYFKNQQTATSFLNESPQTYTDSSPPPLGTLQFLQRICIWRI